MSIVAAEQYMNLMQADQQRIFAFIANEVGMKRARIIAKRVMSGEPMPEEAVLLTTFGEDTGADITINVAGASGDAHVRALVQKSVREAMTDFGRRGG